jgi:hypothetical protein
MATIAWMSCLRESELLGYWSARQTATALIDLLLSQQPQNLINQLAAAKLRIAPLLPVGQVGIAGLLPRRPRRCGVAGGGFDFVQDVEGFPRFSGMTKGLITLDRPLNLPPRFVVPLELA